MAMDAVATVVPDIATGWGTEHVGENIPPDGLLVTAHCRATVPVKLAVGVIVIVELPVDPASTLTAVPVIVKTPNGTTTLWYVMVPVDPAAVPITVTV
jgi:hypothetical protein